ncbi:hypothetical protein MPER_01274 [Moniliophthora perniciosa FA553]|nr:hypothetical protein MPER_01274 [Moniliophthora perniciosa FA553]
MTTYYTTPHTQTPVSRTRKISLSLEDCISQACASFEQKDGVDSVSDGYAVQAPSHTNPTYTYTHPHTDANLDFGWTFPSLDTIFTSTTMAQQQQFTPSDTIAPSVQPHVAHEDWNLNMLWGAPMNNENQSRSLFDYVPQQQQQRLPDACVDGR